MPRIPTSRLGRTARLGGLVAGQGARWVGTRAANVVRSDKRQDAAWDAWALQTADELVTRPGRMKGAAMKLGQVHRARTHDGRDVAVKVQYPGIAEAVETDLRNMGVLLPLVKRLAPGLDANAIAAELRARVGEELDYELEAQHQRQVARAFRGHPFVRVPAVDTSLSARRVRQVSKEDRMAVTRINPPELATPEGLVHVAVATASAAARKLVRRSRDARAGRSLFRARLPDRDRRAAAPSDRLGMGTQQPWRSVTPSAPASRAISERLVGAPPCSRSGRIGACSPGVGPALAGRWKPPSRTARLGVVLLSRPRQSMQAVASAQPRTP